MYWKLIATDSESDNDARADAFAGRFVLHRHTDAQGTHLDLRLEDGDALYGFRIDANELAGEVWATEKAPHSKRWLEESPGATPLDAGRYAIEHEAADSAVIRLDGQHGARRIRAERVPELRPQVLHGLLDALAQTQTSLEDAARLIVDGATARARAVARLCGLARELDGTAFDEEVARKALRGLDLDEIHAHLRAYEVRFDRKYPAAPVSKPERLPETVHERDRAAMEILRG